MKKVYMGIMCCVIILVIILIGFTIHGRDLRQTEIDNALTSSMKSAIEILEYENRPETKEEWEAMFLLSLGIQIESESRLVVNVLEEDLDKGILSVEAILEFKHPNGSDGSVSSMKSILLEEYTEE